MKQIEVHIMQQSYLLGCPPGQEGRLLEAVERVDTAMTRIRDAGKVRARERIAVLAALNLAFEIADRDAAQQARHTEQPAPTSNTDSGADAQRMQALIARLDQVLQPDASTEDEGDALPPTPCDHNLAETAAFTQNADHDAEPTPSGDDDGIVLTSTAA